MDLTNPNTLSTALLPQEHQYMVNVIATRFVSMSTRKHGFTSCRIIKQPHLIDNSLAQECSYFLSLIARKAVSVIALMNLPSA